jgi:hypothetical protein
MTSLRDGSLHMWNYSQHCPNTANENVQDKKQASWATTCLVSHTNGEAPSFLLALLQLIRINSSLSLSLLTLSAAGCTRKSNQESCHIWLCRHLNSIYWL